MAFIEGQVIAFPKDRTSCKSLRVLPLILAQFQGQLHSQC